MKKPYNKWFMAINGGCIGWLLATLYNQPFDLTLSLIFCIPLGLNIFPLVSEAFASYGKTVGDKK